MMRCALGILIGHTIKTTQVAGIGKRNAQVLMGPLKIIGEQCFKNIMLTRDLKTFSGINFALCKRGF
jgi:hypothetical protein